MFHRIFHYIIVLVLLSVLSGCGNEDITKPQLVDLPLSKIRKMSPMLGVHVDQLVEVKDV